MNHAAARIHFAAQPRRLTPSGAIEWEELPSLAGELERRLIVRGVRDFQSSSNFGASAWDATMPATLEPIFEPEPFRETIQGLSTRELRDSDVFRHFFA